MDFHIEGKTHNFDQFQYFISSQGKVIESWNFSCKRILMRCHCPENFSTLEQIVRQGHFGQKRVFRQKPDFEPRFSRLLKPTIQSSLSNLKDSTLVYSITQKKTWDG